MEESIKKGGGKGKEWHGVNKITKKGRKTKTGNCRLVPKREGIRTMSRGDKEGEEEWGAGIGINRTKGITNQTRSLKKNLESIPT